METQVTDGQLEGQEGLPSEIQGEEGETSGGPDRVTSLEAKFDMLLDEIGELKSSAYQARQPVAQQAVEEDYDDDEPVTPSKLKKIVSSAVNQATSKSTKANERAMWDQKIAQDFPLDDAVFQRELKKTSKRLMSSGMDLSHPKALYEVATITAQTMGSSAKPKKRTGQVARQEEEYSAEAPNAQPTPQRGGGKAKASQTVEEQLRFYASVGKKTQKQIDDMRDKLVKREQAGERRRR